MIEGLKKKFLVIAMFSLLLIMAVIIGAINLVNLYQSSHRIDGALRMIADHDGVFPESDRNQPPPIRYSFDFQLTLETQFELRYFSVVFSAEGADPTVDTSHIASVSEGQAREYADKILSKNREKGYLNSQYRYLVAEKSYGTLVVVMNCYTQMQAVTVFFWASCVIALISLGLMFLLVSLFSKRAVRPVQISLDKQKQFITDAGHELKTPLTIISSNADVLELKHGDSEWLASIRKQAARMDGLVGKLLSLSRMEEEPFREVFGDIHLSDVVWESVGSFQPLAEVRGNQIAADIVPKILVWGDKEGLSQLLGILLDNAVKYAAGEGEIQVRLSSSGKRILLQVCNPVEEGNAADSERFFDRFYRADPSRARETGGYGIGLSIAKAIVEAHRGSIRAVAGKDTLCIHVSLPGRLEECS